ncbi:hypothetical protein [Methylobacterium isbiliense]|uniref:Uncharacterized protein n=1 Tax=Methylobacterium isbiliense TaxID=315478 RepID=A0ABQ4SKF1_9HYPH|nr:hypothetical protein [Methylobacterium isbiliense]MDN3626185.1 hypothetical protein [Methylobacterium isbiliense]GJE02965.1 hypothetical protein GMJLKIPL_4915 [Methylobacterium isbiliense]
MRRRQRITFALGIVIAIPLAATDAVLALKHVFPESVAVNFVGQALSVAGVLWFLRWNARRD